ncbi:hypothetical protein AC1031_019156 [Aphanomyces cochlioides]|nr:hypothetical protein AC1031_019156 [Aphanomyces cochlioides]
MRVCVLVAALAGAAQAASSTLWYSCPILTIGSGEVPSSKNPLVQCADIQVPLCHTGVCSSTKFITVFVKRIPASATASAALSAPRAMWMLQGGPGESSVNMEGLMADAYINANRAVSIYTMDHRGTGRSAPISCAEDNDPYSPQMTIRCIQSTKAKYGDVAPQAFSVTSAANDLAYVIQNELAGTDVFVYGLSYGTYLVERLMHIAPKGVKGYILDSIQSEQFYTTKDAPFYSNWDRDVGGTAETFFSYCDKDDLCASKVGPSSKAYLKAVYAALDAGTNACGTMIKTAAPEYGNKPSWLVNNFLYTFLKNANRRNLIPAVMFRLNRCNSADKAMVTNALNYIRNSTSSNLLMTDFSDGADNSSVARVAYLNSEGRSTVVYKNIVLSEIWQRPTPSVAQMTQWYEDALMAAMNPLQQPQDLQDTCIYLGGDDPICANFTTSASVSFNYPRDAYWNKTAAIPTGASVLMFTGKLDPATPPKYARDEKETMAGTNKALFEFDYSPHVIVSNTPYDGGDCGANILASYVTANGDLSQVKSDCIAQVYKLNFTTVMDTKFARTLFGTSSDIWGGAAGSDPVLNAPKTTGSSSGSSSGSKTPSPSGGLSPSPAASSSSALVMSIVCVAAVVVSSLIES